MKFLKFLVGVIVEFDYIIKEVIWMCFKIFFKMKRKKFYYFFL